MFWGMLTKLLSLQADSALSQNVLGSPVTRLPKGHVFSAQVLLDSLPVRLFLNADYLNCVYVVDIKVILNLTAYSCFPASKYCSNGEECD